MVLWSPLRAPAANERRRREDDEDEETRAGVLDCIEDRYGFVAMRSSPYQLLIARWP